MIIVINYSYYVNKNFRIEKNILRVSLRDYIGGKGLSLRAAMKRQGPSRAASGKIISC